MEELRIKTPSGETLVYRATREVAKGQEPKAYELNRMIENPTARPTYPKNHPW